MNRAKISGWITSIVVCTAIATTLIMKVIPAIWDHIMNKDWSSLPILLAVLAIVTVVCVAGVIFGASNLMSFIEGLYLGVNKY